MATASNHLLKILIDSGIMSEREANETERIVIDIGQDERPLVYIKRFGDADVLSTLVASVMSTAQVVTVGGRTTAGEPGQTAYSAYRIAANARSLVSGEPLPMWDDLPSSVRAAWRASADAVRARGA